MDTRRLEPWARWVCGWVGWCSGGCVGFGWVSVGGLVQKIGHQLPTRRAGIIEQQRFVLTHACIVRTAAIYYTYLVVVSLRAVQVLAGGGVCECVRWVAG